MRSSVRCGRDSLHVLATAGFTTSLQQHSAQAAVLLQWLINTSPYARRTLRSCSAKSVVWLRGSCTFIPYSQLHTSLCLAQKLLTALLPLLQADLAAVTALAGRVSGWREGVAAAALAAGWPVAQAGPQAALLLDAGLSVTLRPSLQVLQSSCMCQQQSYKCRTVRHPAAAAAGASSPVCASIREYTQCYPATCASLDAQGEMMKFPLKPHSAAGTCARLSGSAGEVRSRS
jgi:hypothetical protein